jgi:hypothetical protein
VVAAAETAAAISAYCDSAAIGDCRAVAGAIDGTSVYVAGTVSVACAIGVEATIGVIPRASSDEDSADEPVRAVVAVRSAGVGRIGIVSVGAGLWSGVDGSGCTDPYSDGDLSMRKCGREKEYAE